MNRWFLGAALAVGVALGSSEGALAAPTVAFDRECYAPGQAMTMTGSGFTPSGGVRTFFTRLSEDGELFGVLESVAGADGALVVEDIAAPQLAPGSVRDQIGVGANDVTLVEAGVGPPDAVAFATFQVTDTDVRVSRWTIGASRRKKVTIRARGFTLDAGSKLYAHYIRGDRALKRQLVGTLDDACGDLTTRMRQFPASLRPGRYTVAFTAAPRWTPSVFSVRLTARKLKPRKR